MKEKNILIPIPSFGFDPSETAIPWKLLTEVNFNIVFSTPEGRKAITDPIMLNGNKLGICKSILRAKQDAVSAYSEMEKSKEFCYPIKYSEAKEIDFDAIILPGGHDKAVKEYLESKILQNLIVDFFSAKKPVGAICHGVVLVARSTKPSTGKSVIYNYKTTCLLKSQEILAYNLTKFWLKDYYLTYPNLTVEDEVKSVLSNHKNLLRGTIPILRDSKKRLKRGFIVKDRNYISGRWPGDIYNFSLEFIQMVLKDKNI